MPRVQDMPYEVDEEKLVRQFSGIDRKATGVFFTPASLVIDTGKTKVSVRP